MSWRPDRYQPLEHLEGRDVDPAVREELAHHLEARIEENLARGMSREEAVADARRRFGDLERYRQETVAEERQVQQSSRRRERGAVARQEIRRAFRALIRTPAFTVAAIATLGVGIGASIAIFTILDAVVLRPLPYPRADRLVRIFHPVPGVGPGERWNASSAEVVYWGREARALDQVGIYGQDRISILADGQAMQVNAGTATANVLDLLGAKPLAGRLFRSEDNLLRSDPVVLLSERYWRTRLAAVPNVVGSRIRLEGTDATIVGIVAGNLALPDWPVDLWLPVQFDPNAPARNNHMYWALARLAPGATADDATRELAGMVAGYVERFPTAYSTRFFERTGFTTLVLPWKNATVGDTARTLWILLAAAGLVLVIAAVNVANLFLVRSQTTRREVAVRAMLGAGRGQLAWHHFAESGLVSVAAVGVGVLVAWLGLEAFLGAVPGGVDRTTGASMPRLGEVALGLRGVLVAIGLGVVAAVGFGLTSLRLDASAGEMLKARGVTSSRREGRVRSGLIVGQIALAVILLAAAGLLLRSFDKLRSVEPGFATREILVADVALPYNGYDTYPRTTAFYRTLIERLEAIPAVTRASAGSALPIDTDDGCSVFEYRDRRPEVNTSCIANAVVAPGYFTVLGIELEGRDLTWDDLDAKTGASLMTDPLARRLYRNETALGRAVNGPNDQAAPPYTIVGVARKLRWTGLAAPPTEVAFLPIAPIPKTYLWSPPARMRLVARVEGVDPVAIFPDVKRIVREIDPEVVVERPRTMEQVVAGSLVRARLMAILLGIAAGAAMFLSVVGLYGVVAYTVTRRTREIGVRIAVGAPAGRVRAEVVSQSLRLAAAGVAIGIVAAIGLSRVLVSLLFEVSPTDPATLAAVAIIPVVVAGLASLRPAARAAAIDPVAALRAD